MSENVPSDMCVQRRFRSTCAFTQSYTKLHCAHFFMWTTKTLIRLSGCADWFESSLDAHFKGYLFSRFGSYVAHVGRYVFSHCGFDIISKYRKKIKGVFIKLPKLYFMMHLWFSFSYNARILPEPTIRFVRLAKTQIRLRIRAVWSESSLIACAFYSLRAIQRGINENPCLNGWMYKLNWVIACHTCLIVGFVVRWLVCRYRS